MLEVNALAVAYGDVQVLWDVTLRVEQGEIVTLLGANGAGKTTLLRAISRTVPVLAGTIVLGGERIDRSPSARVVELGIAHVPEGRRLWPDMSVEDNLLLGAYPRRARADVRGSLDHVFELFPRIAERRAQIAGTLSGGEQQMVAIARGLMSKPSLLMLDEPSLGLAPIIVAELFETIVRINAAGTTVLLVEQNVRQALEVATRGYVVETGRVVSSGTREELLGSDEIKKAYLGL
jgi:branched-chain amino acid transport system ATP-binding protein